MILDVIRYAVFGVFTLASLIAVGSWAVRTRRISPFGRPATWFRRATDPVLRPIEHAVYRRGGNPQQAEWWLLGGTVIGGIVVISLSRWMVGQLQLVTAVSRQGPAGLLRVVFYYAGQILTLALVIRVIGSWFGVGRFNRLMRPMYWLTDWIVEPLRKVIPPFGMIDVSPIVAWLLIQIVMGIVL